jgi:Mrp family chromosome partitioning ATPase
VSASSSSNSNGRPLGRDALLAEEAQVKKLLEQAKGEMVNIGQKRRNLATLLTQRDVQREELLKVTHRIETLQAEGALGGRLSIISAGEVPLAPSRNLRLPVAAAGLLAAGFFPASLMLLWSLYKGRFRFSDDAQHNLGHQLPLLGILPMLEENVSEQDAVAAQCVHQIRVQLQGRRNDAMTQSSPSSRVLMVTSATAAEGKTSLTLSLGLSFAASGMRTLVIDFDLAGRRLSRTLSAANLPGLPEALAAGHVNGYTQELNALSILTAGSADVLDANTINAASVHRLIASARKDYDVVLIDTGPILGSIEGSLAAREVDGAIMTIARGREQSLVARALSQLKVLGAPVEGVVFNRAEPRDFFRSVYVSSVRHDEDGHIAGTRDPAYARCPFGPLVRAVLSSLPKALLAAPGEN